MMRERYLTKVVHSTIPSCSESREEKRRFRRVEAKDSSGSSICSSNGHVYGVSVWVSMGGSPLCSRRPAHHNSRAKGQRIRVRVDRSSSAISMSMTSTVSPGLRTTTR